MLVEQRTQFDPVLNPWYQEKSGSEDMAKATGANAAMANYEVG
jgi:hypothetical protein